MISPHFLGRLCAEPLLLERPALMALLMQGADARGRGALRMDLPFEDESVAQAAVDEPECFYRLGDTAVITVCGPILKAPDYFERRFFGACDTDDIAAAADRARMDETIARAMLFVRSPGGTAAGVPEAAEALAELRAEKPLYGFTDVCACSAGYWFLSQAQGIYMTRSARVGSIGVYSVYEDLSKFLEANGVTINALQVGKLKLAGAPFKEMTSEERDYLQGFVDRIGVQFKAAVNEVRTIAEESMQGQAFDAELAIEAGLAEGIVRDFDEAISLIIAD